IKDANGIRCARREHWLMLSVVIATHDSERVLLATLSALVPGAVAGLVREVIVADAGSRDATAAIADGGGCRVLESTQAHGARLRLLFLRPGVVLASSWIEETRRFMGGGERGRHNYAAVFRAEPFRPGPLEAMALLGAALGTRPHPSQGLVITHVVRRCGRPPRR